MSFVDQIQAYTGTSLEAHKKFLNRVSSKLLTLPPSGIEANMLVMLEMQLTRIFNDIENKKQLSRNDVLLLDEVLGAAGKLAYTIKTQNTPDSSHFTSIRKLARHLADIARLLSVSPVLISIIQGLDSLQN